MICKPSAYTSTADYPEAKACSKHANAKKLAEISKGPAPPIVPPLRALWSLLSRDWMVLGGVLKGS